MANNLLQSVALGVREQAKAKRQIDYEVCIQRISTLLRIFSDDLHMGREYGFVSLSNDILYILDHANLAKDWTPGETSQIILQAAKRAFGDPMLTYEQKKLRQHCKQYYNPMAFPVSIEPMGIPDEEGVVIKYVSAGGLVNIPTGYTLGGLRSTVTGIAPQLRPCEIVSEKDNQLDITPTDFIEWIKYYPYQLTECCSKAVSWSDSRQALVCTKCNTTVIIHTDKGLVWHS